MRDKYSYCDGNWCNLCTNLRTFKTFSKDLSKTQNSDHAPQTRGNRRE
jgi:hypothetical protein